MNLTIKNSDFVGVLSNILCMLHCLATPLLFVSQIKAHSVPFSWQAINILFIIISAFAIYRSINVSNNIFIKIFMPLFWIILSVFIIDEVFHLHHYIHEIHFIHDINHKNGEIFTYSAASILSLLHVYNLKFCRCENDDCCTNK